MCRRAWGNAIARTLCGLLAGCGASWNWKPYDTKAEYGPLRQMTEAAATGDRAVLRRAMLTDPICNNIADACIADLLRAEREALPGYWYGRRKK